MSQPADVTASNITPCRRGDRATSAAATTASAPATVIGANVAFAPAAVIRKSASSIHVQRSARRRSTSIVNSSTPQNIRLPKVIVGLPKIAWDVNSWRWKWSVSAE